MLVQLEVDITTTVIGVHCKYLNTYAGIGRKIKSSLDSFIPNENI